MLLHCDAVLSCTHPCCVASVAQQQCGGEGLQVLGLGQLGDQALGVHIDPLLFGTGAQVEIQTALKALFDEGGVHWNLPEAVKSLGSELWLIFVIQKLLCISFFLHEGQQLVSCQTIVTGMQSYGCCV